ncbi:hypothetical protein Hanom_Chr15g01337711 [Helianthus anomalus]
MDIDTPPVCTLNRFSVLDVEASAKCGFLVEDDTDLYPADPFNQGLNEKIDHSPAGTSASGRILPNWNTVASTSTSNMDCQVEDMDDTDDDNGYDYGITQAQKDAIRKRLTSKSQTVLAEVANNWEPGERDYFEDLCMELGLDPDFCIEDVAEDVSGTARFFSGLVKDPVVAKPIPRTGFVDIKKLTFGSYCDDTMLRDGTYFWTIKFLGMFILLGFRSLGWSNFVWWAAKLFWRLCSYWLPASIFYWVLPSLWAPVLVLIIGLRTGPLGLCMVGPLEGGGLFFGSLVQAQLHRRPLGQFSLVLLW